MNVLKNKSIKIVRPVSPVVSPALSDLSTPFSTEVHVTLRSRQFKPNWFDEGGWAGTDLRYSQANFIILFFLLLISNLQTTPSLMDHVTPWTLDSSSHGKGSRRGFENIKVADFLMKGTSADFSGWEFDLNLVEKSWKDLQVKNEVAIILPYQYNPGVYHIITNSERFLSQNWLC